MAGGFLPGFKLTTCKNQLPIQLDYELIQLDPGFEECINDRLFLIYTGVPRLAKDLLLSCIRNWYTISERIFKNMDNIVANGQKAAEALRAGKTTSTLWRHCLALKSCF